MRTGDLLDVLVVGAGPAGLATSRVLAQRGLEHRVIERGDRVTSADQPDLYFVGHNYDATGGLYNIAVDAGLVGERLARRR